MNMSNNVSSCIGLDDNTETNLKPRVSDSTIVEMNPNSCHALWVSYMEVHNERIYDLLVDDVDKANREVLKLKEDKTGHPFVKGITEVRCNRFFAVPLLNKCSSL